MIPQKRKEDFQGSPDCLCILFLHAQQSIKCVKGWLYIGFDIL